MALTLDEVWTVLDGVADPEIPVVSLRELGILRDVRHGPQGLEVVITPTYSGCPAMTQMADDVVDALAAHGESATVVTQLAPAWTTDWITEAAREKLRAYGIAPPGSRCATPTDRPADETPAQRVLLRNRRSPTMSIPSAKTVLKAPKMTSATGRRRQRSDEAGDPEFRMHKAGGTL